MSASRAVYDNGNALKPQEVEVWDPAMSLGKDEEAILRRMMAEMMTKRITSVQAPCPAGIVHCDREQLQALLSKCKVVLADFWAEWCGPCRMIEPIVEDVARRYGSRIAVAKINVDENSDLAIEHGVMSIPTLIIFYKGAEHKRLVGYYPGLLKDLLKTIESLIAA